MLKQLHSNLLRTLSLFCVRVLPVTAVLLAVFMHVLPHDGIFLFTPDRLIMEDPSVGAATGYIANVVDTGDLVGSAIRTALFPTVLWIFVAVPCAVGVLSSDSATSADKVSRSRGAAIFQMVLARWAACVICCLVCYVALCSAGFCDVAARIGVSLDVRTWSRFAMPLLVNMLLISVVIAECSAVYCATHSTFITVVVVLTFFYLGTLDYYGVQQQMLTLGVGDSMVSWSTWITPAPFLQHTCSLSFSQVSVAQIAGYGVLAITLSIGAAVIISYVREVVTA